MDNEKGKYLIFTGSSNLAKTEKLLSITQKILSEIKPKYESVRIGNQEWMTRNLDVDRFRNGDLIPHIKSDKEWENAGENKQPAWCYYDNDPENGKKYGKLYNWYAVIDERGIAPEGFHVPTGEEWTILEEYLGRDVAGHKMKSVDGWEEFMDEDGKIQNGNENGNNSLGFNALPGGFRDIEGSFIGLGAHSDFWNGWGFASFITLKSYEYILDWNDMNIAYFSEFGGSVRCLRD